MHMDMQIKARDDETRELIDVFDPAMNRTGTVTRQEAHEKSLRHMAVRVWLVEDGRLVFQERAMSKKLFPGLLDPACTGHVSAGESPQAAAMREILEETGVEPDIADLYCAGALPFAFRRPDGKLDDEFAFLFVWAPKGRLDLEPTGEVAAWRRIGAREYGALAMSGDSEDVRVPVDKGGVRGMASRRSFCCPDAMEWRQVARALESIEAL